jgi:haloacetate dehalogenase
MAPTGDDAAIRTVVVVVDGLRMHCRVAGEGPLVLLLHGWPQTSYCWRFVQPALARAGFTVVAPDLRGYGLSDKPTSGYDKRTMAQDVRALAATFGFDRVRLVGHDRGARVAHRYGLDHPEEVSHLALLDIVPTLATFTRGDVSTARGYWHWLFHLQPDLPELLVGPQIDGYLRYFLERWTVQRQGLAGAIESYVEAFRQPGALRAGFDDYRATDQDLADDRACAENDVMLEMPVLVLWGEYGLPSRLPVLEIWSDFARSVRGEMVRDCGHFLPEEQPQAVFDLLRDFLA